MAFSVKVLLGRGGAGAATRADGGKQNPLLSDQLERLPPGLRAPGCRALELLAVPPGPAALVCQHLELDPAGLLHLAQLLDQRIKPRRGGGRGPSGMNVTMSA